MLKKVLHFCGHSQILLHVCDVELFAPASYTITLLLSGLFTTFKLTEQLTILKLINNELSKVLSKVEKCADRVHKRARECEF